MPGREDLRGWGETTSSLHDERLDAVMQQLLANRAESVADLGCGGGALLRRLVEVPQITRIVGVDSSPRALHVARELLTQRDGAMDSRVTLRQGSITDVRADVDACDAVVLVETIEHLDPARLGTLEHTVFTRLRPRLVIITTPNREYNTLHGLAEGQFRHADHRFEWDRRKFETWAAGVAGRNGYDVAFEGIGPANAWFGSSTQMAIFSAPTNSAR